MTTHETLNWKSLSAEELQWIEQTLDRWEATAREDRCDPTDLCDDVKLAPFVLQRAEEIAAVSEYFDSLSMDPADPFPESIGGVRITKVIARGSNCDVYRGTQDDPERDVAVKLLHGSHSTPKTRRSFKREIDILAKMDHPYIGKVFFAGQEEIGGHRQLFFVMEYIDGCKLTRFTRQHAFGIKQIVQLFVKVCEGIGHAHQGGVIHRDLKPANLFVNRKGNPKILDFGIANLSGSSATQHSQYGSGTPGYMSPEQFSPDLRQDTRSDIYSLGVILYQLLTGEQPYEIKIDSMMKAAAAASTDRRVPLRSRRPDCPRDLAAIVHQCLQRSPADRYQSVQELSEDLQSFLRGDKVKARALSLPERARRLIRRNRGLAAVFAFAMGCLMAGATASFLLWRRADRVATDLELAVFRLEESRDRIAEELSLRSRSSLNHTLATADRNWRVSPDLVRDWLDDAASLQAGPASFAEKVQRHRTQRVIREIKTGTYPIIDLTYSPDEKFLTTVGDNGYVRCWDLSNGEFIWQRRLGIKEVPVCRFHPDGDRILIIDNSQLKLLDSKTGKTIQHIATPEHLARTASFSPKGDLIVARNRSKMITVWDSHLDRVIQQFDLPMKVFATIGIVEDGRTLFAVAQNGNFVFGNIASREISITKRTELPQIHAAAMSPDGKRLAISQRHGDLRIFRSVHDEAPLHVATRPERIDQLSFSRQGDWLLSGNRRRLEARSASTDWAKQWTRQVGAITNVIRFSSWSDHYAIGLDDGRVQHCSLTPPRIDQVICSGLRLPRKLCLNPDQQLAVVAGGSVNAISLAVGNPMTEFSNVGTNSLDIAMSKTGTLYLASGKKRELSTCPGQSHPFRTMLTFEHSVRAVALDEPRQRLAVGLAGGGVQLVQTSDNTILESIPTGPAHVNALAIEPRTGRLACGNEEGEIRIFDANCRSLSRLQAHSGPVTSIAFSSDGQFLATTSHDRQVQIIDLDRFQIERSIKLNRERVRAIAFSPDGQTIAIGGADRNILLCDAKTGELQATLGGHKAPVTDLAFSPDGQSLFSLSLDGTLRRWQPRE
jgi:serine/threonine protein kinase/dipeptidyl aminopeptidase/acylaminoacyl peptidase